MPFALLDDSFHSHPKVLAAGNAAAGLFVRLISWSNAHLTDGFVPPAVALSMGTRREISALVAARRTPDGAGLLEPTDGGWLIHDFLVHNDDAATIRARRSGLSAKRAEAGRRGGIASGASRRSNSEANVKQTTQQIEPPPPPPPPQSSSSTTTPSLYAPVDGGGGRPPSLVIAHAAAEHILTITSPTITNKVAWLDSVAARLNREFAAEITSGLDAGMDRDDLAGEIARLSLGLDVPDVGLERLAGRSFGAALAAGQSASLGELDRAAAVEEINSTSSSSTWRTAALEAYDEAAACDPPPRRLYVVEEA